MEDTILAQTKTIRRRFWRGEITEAEALVLLKPFMAEWRRIASAKAKAAGMRVPVMHPAKFLRTRYDLRWEGTPDDEEMPS